MAPEPTDLVLKALDKLYAHTISLVHPTSKEAVCGSDNGPPKISLKLKVIQEAVKEKGMMDTDSLNFAIRKMARKKSNDGKHYITADFGLCATSNEASDPNLEPYIDEFFVSLAGCNIEVLCLPLIWGGHWTLFAFNMKEEKLSILDSLLQDSDSIGSGGKSSTPECIRQKVCEALQRALASCGTYAFSDWVVDYHTVDQQNIRSNDCGFFVFKFMRHWDGYTLRDFPSKMEEMGEFFRKEFLAYILSSDDDEAHGLPDSLDRLMEKLPSDPKTQHNAFEDTPQLKQELLGPEATIAIVPSTTRGIDSTQPPFYKVVPVTKILVEPCKALKSPFLIKRQSLLRPDVRIVEDLYQYTIKNTLPLWQRTGDIQKIMNCGERMDTVCLNLAVSSLGRQDAHDFRNTKCLGWRHYVDSDWAVNALSGCSNHVDLKNLFYGGSVLYNASRSHMVFIPVVHGYLWSLYAFNMCDQKLSILDSLPDATKGADDPAERHEKIRCKLCDALTVTMDFAIDFRSWEYQFPKVPRQLKRCDSGFFVFNFMRLWDGHQLVRWFPTESRELRKDFLAYILACKDNNIHMPDEISSKIKDLPGKMMDCTMQRVAREGTTLCTENQGEQGGVGSSNNTSPAHVAVQNGPDLEASVERSNEHICFSKFVGWNVSFFNNYLNSGGEAAAMSSAPVSASASSHFLDTCHRVTTDGDGVLHIAARIGNNKLVGDILEKHADLAKVLLLAVNNRGDTPLHCAAAGGSNQVVTLLFGHTDEVIAKLLRVQNLKGETCLHEAVRHGHKEIVETLLEKEKNVSIPDEKRDKMHGSSSIDDLKSPTLVQIVDNEDISPLYLATTLRRADIVQALIKKRYNKEDEHAASCEGPAGKTALHAAVVLLDKVLVKILLEWKAGLTSQVDEAGNTPLHFLASLPSERREPNSIVQFLYKFLFLNFLRQCMCCKLGQELGIAELIMEKDPNSPLYEDNTGSTPVHIAAAHGRLDILKRLLKGCPYCESSRNAIGQTFLHVAVEKESLKIVDYVCGEKKFYGTFCQKKTEFKGIVNAGDQDGNTALHLAIIKASENAINNASEKIFCTLMQNTAVCLNFANNEGRTPLDLAFLRLHPKVISMKGPREWIFFDLLHGGGDFGVCSWDRLAGTVIEPDWEKESERVSKSASMLAVCAVLILNIALLAPFSVLNQKDKENPFNVIAFQAFVVSDSMAFVCSVAATFFCARAGFAMSDGWARLENLITGIYALGLAALALIITVGLALFLVLPGGTGFLPIIIAGFGIFAHLILGFIKSWFASTFAHLSAIRARIGVLQLIFILLFQRSAIKPVWVVPPGSTSLVWSVAFVVTTFVIIISATETFSPGTGATTWLSKLSHQ